MISLSSPRILKKIGENTAIYLGLVGRGKPRFTSKIEVKSLESVIDFSKSGLVVDSTKPC